MAKAWVVLRTVVTNDRCLVRRVCVANHIPPPNADQAETRLHRRRRAVFKTHLLHILGENFRLDCSSAAAWGVNGIRVTEWRPATVRRDPMPTIVKLFAVILILCRLGACGGTHMVRRSLPRDCFLFAPLIVVSATP